MNKLLLILIGVFLSILLILCSCHTLVGASNESAAIQSANISINTAFANVLSVEKAGGNVSQLIANLNVAGELLAQAENSFQSGDLTSVSSNADNARLIANQVNAEALSLKNAGVNQSQNQLLFTVLFSIVGILIYTLFLLIVWRHFKRGYSKSFLSLKPEVAGNGA